MYVYIIYIHITYIFILFIIYVVFLINELLHEQKYECRFCQLAKCVFCAYIVFMFRQKSRKV